MDLIKKAKTDYDAVCKNDSIDPTISDPIFNEFFPMILIAHEVLGTAFEHLIIIDKKIEDIRIKNSFRLVQAMGKIRRLPQAFTIEERAAISLHLEYIPMAEGIFSTSLNLLVFTLINNNIPFTYRGREVIALDEIAERSLGDKLRYLKDNNKLTIITDNITRDLRNNIGHMTYQCNLNGVIEVDNKKIDYEKQYRFMRDIGFCIQECIRNYHKYYR